MDPLALALAQLVADNPHVHLAFFRNQNKTPIIEAHTAHAAPALIRKVPSRIQTFRIKPITSPIMRIQHAPYNLNQECQNEPIYLGTQLQPQGAAWVGTAGAPVSWEHTVAHYHYGILSNWHVMASGAESVGRPQHQPDDFSPTCARLTAWKAPDPDGINFIDAAIADAEIDGFHTISQEILGLGKIASQPQDATPGRPAKKSGRTTSLTNGLCSAVGAAVRVSYGAFEALFADQDVYEDLDKPFSAPGDSGSLIVGSDCNCPMSLLFAGGGNLTIGNPIRYVNQHFQLTWLW